MCGIAGIVGRVRESDLRLMTQILHHRGPDDGAVWISAGGEVGFGHRRLKIIDPSPAARQPMLSDDGRFTLTFNGEIFNFRELRAELRRRGLNFRTESDSEVLLQGFAAWGEGVLDRLIGQFAFAIWDQANRTLFAARDHLGIKPFYYAFSNSSFLFASEAKALLAVSTELRRPRLDLISAYLSFLWVPGSETLFEGVSKLLPGSRLRLKDGRVEVDEYWHPAACHKPELPAGDRERAEAFRETFEQAVQSQLVSDVPLGLLLSGGIDSTAVLAAMSKTGARAKAFTATYARRSRSRDVFEDDLPYARLAAAHFGAELTERRIEADMPELLNRAVWHLDEPLGDPTVVTNLALTREAKSSLTVLLTGMGADEILAGYPRYPAALYGGRFGLLGKCAFPLMRGIILGMRRAGALTIRRTRRADLLLRHANLTFPQNYLALSTYFDSEHQRSLLKSGAGMNSMEDPYRFHRSVIRRCEGMDALDVMLVTDLSTFLPCLNLENMDKTAMANSVEMRVPFLDHRLVAFALALPRRDKLRLFTRKAILREAYKGVIPGKILTRRKTGYSPPVRAWMRSAKRDFLMDTLFTSQSTLRSFLDDAELRRLLRENDEGLADNSMKLWMLLVLELWFRIFIDSWNPPAVPDPALLPRIQ